MSSAIYRANELGRGPITIPLKGLAIGNGMTVPLVQFPAYADYALENGLISQGVRRGGGGTGSKRQQKTSPRPKPPVPWGCVYSSLSLLFCLAGNSSKGGRRFGNLCLRHPTFP